jgi:hypothetical protein
MEPQIISKKELFKLMEHVYVQGKSIYWTRINIVDGNEVQQLYVCKKPKKSRILRDITQLPHDNWNQ